MKILSFVKSIFKAIQNLLSGKRQKAKDRFYCVKYTNDFPDDTATYVLYLLGKPGYEWLAGMNCPCGCGEFIELVLDGRSPNWHISISNDGKPTLSPSIQRSVNCRSHFFLRKGKIHWCKE